MQFCIKADSHFPHVFIKFTISLSVKWITLFFFFLLPIKCLYFLDLKLIHQLWLSSINFQLFLVFISFGYYYYNKLSCTQSNSGPLIGAHQMGVVQAACTTKSGTLSFALDAQSVFQRLRLWEDTKMPTGRSVWRSTWRSSRFHALMMITFLLLRLLSRWLISGPTMISTSWVAVLLQLVIIILIMRIVIVTIVTLIILMMLIIVIIM